MPRKPFTHVVFGDPLPLVIDGDGPVGGPSMSDVTHLTVPIPEPAPGYRSDTAGDERRFSLFPPPELFPSNRKGRRAYRAAVRRGRS